MSEQWLFTIAFFAWLIGAAAFVDTPPTERFVGTPSMTAIARHLGAQGAHGGGGAVHVLPFEQAVDHGLADRQGAEHQRAM